MSKRKVEKEKTLVDYLDEIVLCMDKMATALEKLVNLWIASVEATQKQTKGEVKKVGTSP
jgi:uncharacterized membrane protein